MDAMLVNVSGEIMVNKVVDITTTQVVWTKPQSMLRMKMFSIVLLACANLADMKQDIATHIEMITNGFQCDMFVKSALVGVFKQGFLGCLITRERRVLELNTRECTASSMSTKIVFWEKPFHHQNGLIVVVFLA